MIRVGLGYDSHRLVEGRPLVLGGLRIPFERGLDGHSDADVVAHALTDALLGAAGAGDIGRLFPDTAPEWKDADSLALLRQACQLIRERGFRPQQADITIIAERPRLGNYFAAMAARLSDATGLAVANLGLKAKTNEGMGWIGRGEGIAVMAVATVESP
jgi:2-C-methyl-D-erythritol 2,4-cyclodiphosphate synthase